MIFQVENAIEENVSCLVYCRNGVNKSAAVVSAYLMRKYGLDIVQAISICKIVQHNVDLDKFMMFHLLKYQTHCMSKYSKETDNTVPEILNDSQVLPFDEDLIKGFISKRNWEDLRSLDLSLKGDSAWVELICKNFYEQTLQDVENMTEQYPDIYNPSFKEMVSYSSTVKECIRMYLPSHESSLFNAVNQAFYKVLYKRDIFFDSIVAIFQSLISSTMHGSRFESLIKEYCNVLQCLLEMVPMTDYFCQSYKNSFVRRFVKKKLDLEKENIALFNLEPISASLVRHVRRMILASEGTNSQLQLFTQGRSLVTYNLTSFDEIDFPKSYLKPCLDKKGHIISPILPEDVALSLYTFTQEFNFNDNRKLCVLPQYGEADIHIILGSSSYSITVSTSIMCVLSQVAEYSDFGPVSFAQLLKGTNLPEKILTATLSAIIRGKYPGTKTKDSIIVFKAIKEKKVDTMSYMPEDTFGFNEDFKSKAKRFRIPFIKT